jgi:NAD(P)-dependent dehydrogenase (short-subunit alcohol dehydrogenase family)
MCMIELAGRVAVVTGAGRGLGREHALLLGSEGVMVVVNDRGVDNDGTGGDPAPAAEVAAEIRAHGGKAVASDHDIASWDGARAAVALAIESFGDLDIVVNSAGILRDVAIVNMTESDFDEVVRVHMKGHVAPTRWAASHWREQHKLGSRRPRNLVHTSSTSGIYANPGQSNYGSAKSGIVTFSQIAAKELARYGVVSNCVLPGARTRLTMSSPGLPEIMEAPAEGFDVWAPGNASPVVAYLCAAGCPFTGDTFYVQGGTVRRLEPWSLAGETIEHPTRWSLEALTDAMTAFKPRPRA